MRKKFTLLFAALLACVGVMKAQYYVIESVGENITDLSALTENSYVALYNVGKSKYIYEGGDHKLYMGTAAEAGAGHEYIWQVHKEGDTFLFTSASGRYFSTPLDSKDVYTVKSDNAAKDKFTITAHSEDKNKWLVKSSNANIYWDAQDARFVGWSGSGANSRYEIRPVTVSAATENDFNKLITTSEDDIKWYTIKNVSSGKFATYAGDAATMTQQAAISGPSLFYFTGRATADGATVGIHNLFAGDNLCTEYNSWTATGREWLISKQTTGLSIAYPNNANKAWNNANGWGNEVGYWGAGDGGSAWQIEIVTDFTEYLTAAKAAAIAEIESLAGVSAVYANVAEQFKAEVEGVTANSAESLLAVNNILENYRKTIDGKSMKFRVDGRGSRFLGYSTSNNRIETQVLAFDDAYWTLKYVGNGYFKLYNPVHKVWLGAPDGAKKINEDESETSYTAGLADEADASLYKFEVTTGGTTVLLVAGNGNITHAANDNHIMHYHATGDQASWWAITDVVTFSMNYDEYKDFLSEKSAKMNQLIGYAKQLQDNYGLVKSGDKIAVVVNHPGNLGEGDSQPSSNLLDGNNGTYVHSSYNTTMEGEGENQTMSEGHMNQVEAHYIEVELSEATQNIFCYFSKRNNSNRPAIIKVLAGNSADALNEVATLNLPESADNNVQAFFSEAIDLGAEYTHLRFVVTKTNTNTKYFTLSEFYVLPVNDVTSGIAALAGASIADADLETRLTAAENSLKTLQLPETLAEVKAALDANVSNHVTENPALGQYTTVAYNELKAAYEACTSIEQLDAVFAAFDKFKKAKNLPVFMISNGNVKDYAKDKSIYDDNDGKLNFKATNVYDKTMWWALDITETAVKVTEKVDIYNVGTGNGFWDAASIKITETSENIADDNIFLFYTVGGSNDNTPIHFQSDYSEIVHWGSTEATSGSAAMFTYIGNTNDLNKLTENHVAAVVDKGNSFRTFYTEFPAAINEATAEKTIDLISNITLDQAIDINKVVTLNLNGKTITRNDGGYAFKVTGELSLENEAENSINGGIHYIINDNDYKQAEKAYAMSTDKVGVDISYIRSFGHNNWQVLYVPFDIPVASMSEFDVYAITNASDEAVVVDQVTEGELSAHTPYLIKAKSTGDKTIFVEDGTLKAAPKNDYSQVIGGYTFTGTYAAKPITAETEYVLTGGEWCQLDNSNQVLGAFRVYLTVDGSAAPVLRIMTRGEEDTTAIDSAVLNVQPSSVIYDLLGRRVEKMDKGIYIVNGRKVVVK